MNASMSARCPAQERALYAGCVNKLSEIERRLRDGRLPKGGPQSPGKLKRRLRAGYPFESALPGHGAT